MKKRTLKYAAASFLIIMFLLIAWIPLTGKEAQAAVKNQSISNKELQAGKLFTLTNMPSNSVDSIKAKNYKKKVNYGTTQNFAFTPDGKYIFSVGECTEGKKIHGFLARCKVPKEFSADSEAKCREVFVLQGYGHSDSIAITQDDPSKEIYNIWLSCKADSSGLGTEIARLTYKVDAKGAGKITKTVYITNFKSANTKKGKAVRFAGNAAARYLQVAIDEESNQIVFHVTLSTDSSQHYLSYDLKKLNAALNKVKNNKAYKISKAAKYQRAHVLCTIAPLMSFQSFTVKGNSLYIAGSNYGLGAEFDVINYKLQKSKKVKVQNKNLVNGKKPYSKIVSMKKPIIRIFDADYDKDYLEIEGLNVEKGPGGKFDYYFNFNCLIPRGTDTTAIYKVTK